MLRRARALCWREQWTNVELTQCDAIEYIPCEPLDGILFGLCYNTMPHHLAVLHHAWKQLRPGGRVVIMDGKLPSGLSRKLLLPFSLWLMKRTMLGNPFIKPWNDLAAIADTFEMEEFLFGSWYVCWGSKSSRPQMEEVGGATEQLIAAEWRWPAARPPRVGLVSHQATIFDAARSPRAGMAGRVFAVRATLTAARQRIEDGARACADNLACAVRCPTRGKASRESA